MMKRRILTGLLACCLSLSLALPGFAAGAIPSPGEVSQVVTALGILDGNSGGSLELSRNVTRAEFITMALTGTRWGRPPPPPTRTCPTPTGRLAMWRPLWPPGW